MSKESWTYDDGGKVVFYEERTRVDGELAVMFIPIGDSTLTDISGYPHLRTIEAGYGGISVPSDYGEYYSTYDSSRVASPLNIEKGWIRDRRK